MLFYLLCKGPHEAEGSFDECLSIRMRIDVLNRFHSVRLVCYHHFFEIRLSNDCSP